MPMITIKEIAKQLNLSSATVSRALRNDESLSISAETKTKIFMTAEALGYVAKSRKSTPAKASRRVAVVHNNQTFRHQIDSSYYYSVRTGIEELCQEKSFSCFFVPLDALASCQEQADGVIIVGNYTKDRFDSILSRFKDVPMATVGIISYYPERIDHITHSNFDSVNMALDFLFQKGHTQIGYMGIEETPGTILFGSRKQCFIDRMQEKGLYRPEWVRESSRGRDRVEQGYLMMEAWLAEGGPRPTAIFCANDPIALGVTKVLYTAKIDIPNEISILTHDGSYPTQYSVPPLSTIDVHPYQLGREAVLALAERMTQKRGHTKKIILYPELIDRNSVRDLTRD